MAIKITCLNETEQNFVNNNKLYTTLYGILDIVDNLDTNEYSYFDSILDYDLFVNNINGDTKALKVKEKNINESVENSKINSIISHIKEKYKVDTIKYDDIDSSIIVKVDENNIDTLNNIEDDFKSNENLDIEKITDRVLFIKVNNNEIQLDEDDSSLLDKLNDQDMKNIITKSGVKLKGDENKDHLKGIIHGMLSNAK